MGERERIARKVAALREEAARLDVEAGRDTSGMVPEHGQPILVGHHSERAHRGMLDRARKVWDRQADATRRAGELRRTAAALEAQSAVTVYDDDPDAGDRLRARVAALEAERAAVKRDPWHTERPAVRADVLASISRQIRQANKRLKCLPEGGESR